MQLLLTNNSLVLSVMDEQDRTPLHAAAQAGHTDCIRVMLKFGAHAETTYAEHDEHSVPLASALHSAAASGNSSALKMLLEASSKNMVHAVDSFDRTPLHVAALNGHTECVEVRSALHAGRSTTHALAILTAPEAPTRMQVLLSADAGVKARNSWGATALQLAARKKSPAIVGLLLAAGAEVDAVDNHGMSALHYAAQAASLPCMQLLLSQQAPLNRESTLQATPLSLAAVADSDDATAAVQMLLHAGASLSCLLQLFGELPAASKAAVQAHVRRTSLATAASIKAFSAQQQEAGTVAPALCSDVMHVILGRTFDVEEVFLRILLDGAGEGRGCTM
jgi:uncharacterized protein